MTAQWVQLATGDTLVANHEGAWIQPAQAAALSLWGSMPPSTPATPATTRHLLEGALAAAEQAAFASAERVASSAESPPIDRATWALNLIDQWYTAHHSVALLSRAIDRYRQIHRPDLARFTEKKLAEEAGHDLFAVNDLKALGYDAHAAAEHVPPSKMARALVEYGRTTVASARPVSFLGYVFALERRITRITAPMLDDLERKLGVQAASGVRAHALELDEGHVEELVEFIARLPAEDRTEVALACHTTAAICCLPQTPHQAERQRELAKFRNHRSKPATEGVNK